MEQGVLGCVLLSPNECLALLIGNGFRREQFYDLRHQEIWTALVAMHEQQLPIEVTTLARWLEDRHLLEQVGGVQYLALLPDAVPSASNLDYYAQIVREKYLLRRLLQACGDTAVRVYDYEGDVPQLLDEAEAAVLAVNTEAHGAGQHVRSMPELVDATTQAIETMRRGVGLMSGIRTHFGHLDKWTAGLHPTELVIVAARPSLGKTSLAMGIARNVAIRERMPVGVFSMEMGSESLTLRLLCAEASVDSHKLRTGFPSHDDLEAMAKASPKISAAPIFIDDTPALGILELRARARRMHQQHGIRLFVVDYLQLMHGSKDYGGNRALEVAEISGGLKSLGKELNVAMLVLSQLNRETEKNKSRKPQLADLRESGAIEQDADVVLMLYRPKADDDEVESEDTQRVNVLIAKQRNGPSDWDVEMTFWKKFTRFEDAYQNKGHVLKPADNAMPTSAELGLKPKAKTDEQ